MWTAFKSSWALFAGIALIMTGNGLQGSLLGVRASLESFDSQAVGLIMSAFYVGFIFGSAYTPQIVRSVGHIRVFAAWASLASAAVLLHGVIVEPAVWVGMRFVTGFAYAGMYVVAESWLNDRSDNTIRGAIMSLYMVVQYAGLAMGQLFLNASDPAGITLFILVSIFVSLALVPISLSSSPAPLFDASEKVSIRELLKLTPFGLAACAIAGLTTGALLGMGAVYSQLIGLSVQETSYFMGMLILGGVIIQLPLGRLSDRMSRRALLVIEALLAASIAAVPIFMDASEFLIPLAFGVGGITLPLYGLAVAHANDDLRPEQMVGASSALVLVFGLGAAAGPVLVSFAMDEAGGNGFFAVLIAANVLLAVYGLYRMTRREAVPVDEMTEFKPMPIGVAVPPEALDIDRETRD